MLFLLCFIPMKKKAKKLKSNGIGNQKLLSLTGVKKLYLMKNRGKAHGATDILLLLINLILKVHLDLSSQYWIPIRVGEETRKENGT